MYKDRKKRAPASPVVHACLLCFQQLLQLLHLQGGLVLIAALLVLLPHPALPSTRTHSLNARGQLSRRRAQTEISKCTVSTGLVGRSAAAFDASAEAAFAAAMAKSINEAPSIATQKHGAVGDQPRLWLDVAGTCASHAKACDVCAAAYGQATPD